VAKQFHEGVDAHVRGSQLGGIGVAGRELAHPAGCASGPARLNARLIRECSVPRVRSPSRPTKSGDRVGHCDRPELATSAFRLVAPGTGLRRQRNCQIRQSPNSPAGGRRDQFRHSDGSVAIGTQNYPKRLGALNASPAQPRPVERALHTRDSSCTGLVDIRRCPRSVHSAAAPLSLVAACCHAGSPATRHVVSSARGQSRLTKCHAASGRRCIYLSRSPGRIPTLP
jgi:hypothetical protein